MARPLDPVDDVQRSAELLDQAITLVKHGGMMRDVLDIMTGLANRLRQDVDLIRAGKLTDGNEA